MTYRSERDPCSPPRVHSRRRVGKQRRIQHRSFPRPERSREEGKGRCQPVAPENRPENMCETAHISENQTRSKQSPHRGIHSLDGSRQPPVRNIRSSEGSTCCGQKQDIDAHWKQKKTPPPGVIRNPVWSPDGMVLPEEGRRRDRGRGLLEQGARGAVAVQGEKRVHHGPIPRYRGEGKPGAV